MRAREKHKINELEGNSENKNIKNLYSSINESKKDYKLRFNFASKESG
jgi:hypothetical protein